MRKLHLHIGSPKTGSTSIQRTLQANKRILYNNYNLLYPGKAECHNLLFFLSKAPTKYWRREYKGLDVNELSGRVVRYTQTIFNEIMDTKKDVIISTEYLFWLDKEEWVKNVINFFGKIFSEIIVYVFVREPAEFYKSLQQQHITARKYVDSPFRFKYGFKESINSWEKYCKLKVLKFSKSQNSLDTFLKEFGVNKTSLDDTLERENITMGIEQMKLLQEINCHVYPTSSDILIGKVHLKKIPLIRIGKSTKPLLKQEISDLVNYNHREELNWLSNNYGVEFSIDKTDPTQNIKEDLLTKKTWKMEDIYSNFDPVEYSNYKYSLLNELLLKY